MLQYARASSRESDGAENCVVMKGDSGYIGASFVYAKYLEDGYIKISGNNAEDRNGWKVISEWSMEKGKYTLCGLDNLDKETLELQLSVWNDQRQSYDYYCQFNEEVSFEIAETTRVKLMLHVYPNATNINVIARPAVYQDE